jgi:hypothetical protein
VKLNELLARIKWQSVIVLLAAIVVLAAIFWGALDLKPVTLFAPTYKEGGNVQVRSWADPGRVELRGTSTARVEVKNIGKESNNVLIRLETYNPSLLFDETGSQKANESISLGPGESRELGFKLRFNATYGGKYGVKVTVSPGGENIDDEIYFDVFEK